MASSIFTNEDKGDTQALIRTAFDEFGCNFLLLRITDAGRARLWLREQLPRLTRADQIGHDKEPVKQALQIALTAAGLRELKLAPEVVDQFASEFTIGLAEDPSRSRRLGDIGRNAPSEWSWGVGDREPHVLVMLFAETGINDFTDEIEGAALAAGLSKVERLSTANFDGVEPFGFRDGGSQPTIDWEGARKPGSIADMDYPNLIATGEFLLGHRNEYGLYTERPLLDTNAPGAESLPKAEDRPDRRDLGRNGSYLVFRQLHQDVTGFWRWVYQEAGGDEKSAIDLAEAMVGRHMDGEPFAGLGKRDIIGVKPPKRNETRNDFNYSADRTGQVCPVGAHIRRSNPRTGDYPTGRTGVLKKLLSLLGLTGTAEDDRIASARFHRLLRRGREYGGPGSPAIPVRAARMMSAASEADTPSAEAEAGLHFICLNANLARQFEFVQGAWLASAKFAGMTNEQDPVLGNRQPFPGNQPNDRFTRPQAEGPCRVYKSLPQFVTVRGGAYFFLPGLRALSWLLRDQ